MENLSSLKSATRIFLTGRLDSFYICFEGVLLYYQFKYGHSYENQHFFFHITRITGRSTPKKNF